MPDSSLIPKHRRAILDLARRHGASHVRVFGSTAKGTAGPDSDVDFLVAFEPGRSLIDFVALKQDLEDLLGCPVDLVSEGALHHVIQDRVLAEAEVL